MKQTGEDQGFSKKSDCCGCLEPMEDGHNTRSSKKRLLCMICKEPHPTLLHGYIPKNTKERH